MVETYRDLLLFGCMPGYKNVNKRYNMQALQGQIEYAQGFAPEDRPVVKLADLIRMRELKAQGIEVPAATVEPTGDKVEEKEEEKDDV